MRSASATLEAGLLVVACAILAAAASSGCGAAGAARTSAPEAGSDAAAADAPAGDDQGPAPAVRSDGMTRAAACAAFATALAQRRWSCAPTQRSLLYGDEQTYIARLALFCELLDLPGAAFPADPLAACLTAAAAEPCADPAPFPVACVPPGALPNGATCAHQFQCASLLCDAPVAVGCGVCAAAPAEGEACVGAAQRCVHLACVGGRCRRSRGAGESCGADAPCGPSLECAGAACQALSGAGESCAARNCDASAAVLCDRATTTCVAYEIDERICGTNPQSGLPVACERSGFCRNGSCVRASDLGEPCSPTDGPNCLWPGVCYGGICRRPADNRAACAGPGTP